MSGYIFAIKSRIDNRKKLVKQQYILQISSQYAMVNFGLPSAEIDPEVWGTPANYGRPA